MRLDRLDDASPHAATTPLKRHAVVVINQRGDAQQQAWPRDWLFDGCRGDGAVLPPGV